MTRVTKSGGRTDAFLVVTGWNDGLCQDYCKKLHKWFSSRLDARQVLRRWFGEQKARTK